MWKLIQEDWRDFVAAFYFPSQSKIVTDERIEEFLEQSNSELLKGTKPDVIILLVRKALNFFEQNMDIIETLISNLKDEQMFEAVLFIAKAQLQIGESRQNHRLQTFANLLIGELYINELEK